MQQLLQHQLAHLIHYQFSIKKAIGYGAGSRDLKEQPNVLRVRLGELSAKVSKEKLVHIEANIDDMNPEVFSYFFEILFENGARDVFLTPIIMKKAGQDNSWRAC